MDPAILAQGCNIWGSNRRLSEYQLKRFPHLQKGKLLGEWRYLLAQFLFLRSLLTPLLEAGYWAGGTFSLTALMLPSDFVYKIVEDESKAASGMK